MQESLVDKLLGVVGMMGFLVAGVAAGKSLNVLVRGPSAASRLSGLAGFAIACPAAWVSLYLGYLLLRYPSERRTTAAEVARDAARQKTPLTSLWVGG